ncbi:hypothetical protein NDU88_008021 [Pleurodeles waltl]|uniref:Uncharacterized protein n=1 Tax=Pleurodeles waltl TaxID=8319 RepID=A0AAV7N8I6_PLEWA|nr:hypothetical protein NDU88_008021 [Pleurodeles waltl]
MPWPCLPLLPCSRDYNTVYKAQHPTIGTVSEENRGPVETLFTAVPVWSACSNCPVARGPVGKETMTNTLRAGVDGPPWELMVMPWMPTKGKQRAKSQGQRQMDRMEQPDTRWDIDISLISDIHPVSYDVRAYISYKIDPELM